MLVESSVGAGVALDIDRYIVPVSVPLSQFRPSALAGPVRRTWVRVLIPEPSRVKSESADYCRCSTARRVHGTARHVKVNSQRILEILHSTEDSVYGLR